MERIILESAIENAIMQGKRFHSINGRIVHLPTPQKTGTHYQRKTYAKVKAIELCNIYDK